MAFSSLGLSPALLAAVNARAFALPSPIQTLAIPAALLGRDVIACAQTGSGKTIAYVLPVLQQLVLSAPAQPRRLRALILVPTRELAAQVGEEVRGFAVQLELCPKVVTVFGGVSINVQMMELRGGADIVVATPGRLLDLVDHNALSLSEVTTLVLDEADRLIDLGFAEELGRVLALLPSQRQHLLFSATFPPSVQALAARLLRDPVRIDVVPPPEALPDIEQRAIAVDPDRRTQLLCRLIQENPWSRVLVFVATKHASEKVAGKLRKARIDAEPFHGELSQGKRTQVLADFKASRLKVVLATDVAARGLDIAELSAVVNYDLPRSPVDYTHRIGRTGRAGLSGVAISFVTPEGASHFRLIEKRQHRRVPLELVAGFEPVVPPEHWARRADDPEDGPRTGGVKGRRMSKKDKLRLAAGQATSPPGGDL